MENEFQIQNIFYLLGLFFLLRGTFYMVKQQNAVVIERLGKFNKVSKAGLHVKIPFIDRIAGNVNLRVRELPVEVETKTKDDVFVKILFQFSFLLLMQRKV